jgi:hypothetical protein
MDAAYVPQADHTPAQRFDEMPRGGHCVFDGEVDADADDEDR